MPITFLGRPVLAVCIGLALLPQAPGQLSARTPPADEVFAEAQDLRARGDFDQAISLLSSLTLQDSLSEPLLRKAHNDLIFTQLSKRNASVDTQEQNAIYADLVVCTETALERFPDLKAGPEYPPEMNLIYDTRRALMFGRVEVTCTADSSMVILRAVDHDNVYEGATPFVIPYVRVGEYAMRVARPGYKDREFQLSVGPSAILQREVTLSKERTRKWWLTRVVVPVTAAAAAVAAIIVGTRDNSSPDPTNPLDEPPPPPGQ